MRTMPRHRTARSWRKRQRGAVAIIVGLLMVVLIGFIGLALDGGHLYLTKTELQNGADACALAASYELTGSPTIPGDAFARAVAAGKLVGTRNQVDFQGTFIPDSDIQVQFSDTLAGGGWVDAPPAGGTYDLRYVRCTIARNGIAPWFMQVLGFGPQTVAALATATLSPSQLNCAVPMALCVKTGQGPPYYGYTPGDWVGLDFTATANLTGNFRWIDFTPAEPASGNVEINALLKGAGQCSLPPPIPPPCNNPGAANQPTGCIGSTGNPPNETAYNSRFGVYKNGAGNPQLTTNSPDITGYAYAWDVVAGVPMGNWPLGRNAYAGSVAGQKNFQEARTAHLGTENLLTPPAGFTQFYANAFQPSSVAQHITYGSDRRLVTVPVVNCDEFTTPPQYAATLDYACVLLLDTMRTDGPNTLTKFEYLGPSNPTTGSSPCGSSGVAGSSTSAGPLVPTLVQ